MTRHFHAVIVRNFGIDAARADYHGYQWGIHLGWWLIFIGNTEKPQ
jgi:hypothetical protein